MAEHTTLSKLHLIAKFKELLYDEPNKNQTLKEAISKENKILISQFATIAPETRIAEKSTQTVSDISHQETPQNNFYDEKKQNASPQVVNQHFDSNNNRGQQNDIVLPKTTIDVLILITNENMVNYVKETFKGPGIRFFHHLQDLKFENPTIIVRISASRNLDTSLEDAIQTKRPKKSVTMILLNKGSVSVSDKEIMVPNTQTKINAYAFLYNDQTHEPPYRRKEACETKGIFQISDVFNLIRRNT